MTFSKRLVGLAFSVLLVAASQAQPNLSQTIPTDPNVKLGKLSNGLSYLINRMMGQPIFAHVTLEKGERSALADLASELL